jgi:UDP-N-acetylmuramoyl-tripeptide--D-alanyl-D-alanine ligase
MLVEYFALMNAILLLMPLLLFAVSPLIVEYGVVVPLWLGQKIIQGSKQRKLLETARQIMKDNSTLKIAIAGSYGKTTAKEILRTVLSEGKKVAFTPGNINTLIGISKFIQSLDGNEDVTIFELGEERVGDIRDLCDLVQPNMGIITGINEAHLSSFGTLDRTTATIFELEDYLSSNPLYKNQESLLVKPRIKYGDKLAFSKKGVNGWSISNIKSDIHGMNFDVKKGGKITSMHTGLLGDYNVGIIAAAIDIAFSMGLNIKQIQSGIEKTLPFEHRMQPRKLNGVWVIDDTYNGNSEGVRVGLNLLKNLDAKRRIYITPGLVEQGDKTQEIHENIGRQIARVADVVVLIKNSVTDYISDGLRAGNFTGKLLIIDDPLEFYENLDAFVAYGDVVLMQNDWTDNYT